MLTPVPGAAEEFHSGSVGLRAGFRDLRCPSCQARRGFDSDRRSSEGSEPRPKLRTPVLGFAAI